MLGWIDKISAKKSFLNGSQKNTDIRTMYHKWSMNALKMEIKVEEVLYNMKFR